MQFQLGLAHWALSFLDRAGGRVRWLKLMDPGHAEPLPDRPDVSFVIRFYEDEATARDEVMRGAVGARQRLARLRPLLEPRSWLNKSRFLLEHMNEPTNALILKTRQGREALDRFTAEYAKLLWYELGIRSVGYCLGVGHPEPHHVEQLFTKGFPALIRYGGAWSYHSYGWPDIRGASQWYSLRYRKAVDAYRALGNTEVPPLHITEWGLDKLLVGEVGGWQLVNNDPRWLVDSQVAWMDEEVAKDDYVVAFYHFTATAEQTWRSYELREGDAEVLADYIAATPTPAQPPAPPPKPAPKPAPTLALAFPLKRRWKISCDFQCHQARDSTAPGIDVACPTGTPIYAPAAGKISGAMWRNAGGRSMWITHAGGWKSYIAHLNSFSVCGGEQVYRNALLGFTGNTGKSTGPHLHFSVKNSAGQWIDPGPMFDEA